jgi:hypothetical protein
MLDFARSVAAAKTIPLERKACYKNALLTMLSNKEYQSGWYVEGFAIPTIGAFRIPMEHGWLELPDGSIIDPSFADLGHTEVAYFPAMKLQWQRVLKLCRDNPSLPSMLSHQANRHRAAYLKARSDAHRAVFGEAFVPSLHRLEEMSKTAAPRQPLVS